MELLVAAMVDRPEEVDIQLVATEAVIQVVASEDFQEVDIQAVATEDR
jgi:predicted RNA-binding protein YlqC (UPF0109 family)